MFDFWSILGLVGLGLQLLLLRALAGGSWRKYPLVFAYCIVLTIATGVDAYNFLGGGMNSVDYRKFYWINDSVLRSLLYFMVIALTYQAMEGHPKRTLVARLLAGSAVLIIGYSVWETWTAFPHRPGVVFTVLSRNLNFVAALLNMVLWSALVRRPKRDLQLLLISAGLGIEVTGEAVAHSLRTVMGRDQANLVWIPNLLAIATHLMCLAIWWFALRYPPEPEKKPLPDLDRVAQ
jgi:hypothetical protein